MWKEMWIILSLPAFTKDLGTKAMNTALVVMFAEGFWIRSHKGQKIARWLLWFLDQYQKAARLSFLAGRSRFAIVPKAHFIHHLPLDMLSECARSKWCRNPLATSCQMQESFIGIPSRVSRRVSIRLAHLRTLQRSLLISRQSLDRALRDPRGMDAYPDKP